MPNDFSNNSMHSHTSSRSAAQATIERTRTDTVSSAVRISLFNTPDLNLHTPLILAARCRGARSLNHHNLLDLNSHLLAIQLAGTEQRPKHGDEGYVERPENAFILFQHKSYSQKNEAEAAGGVGMCSANFVINEAFLTVSLPEFSGPVDSVGKYYDFQNSYWTLSVQILSVYFRKKTHASVDADEDVQTSSVRILWDCFTSDLWSRGELLPEEIQWSIMQRLELTSMHILAAFKRLPGVCVKVEKRPFAGTGNIS
ncbi:uncharacterized protein FOMMEDRAFT_151603 [Fomitiporia mediterranea MF3/22]|uniref:uncharacterized protein n=1 Tax=Fomitiporia mediterranea (strain MF3/22) TaxID=694068 RepID=UPI0004409A93|nr:uncharacterized protein FOMMEDRAFT_151603 [Fomitiporia mediterranea MF3/22]EJD06362.1 hypothetical protein FOMMEDRAFT_151603 [Fomitiporia mediterranea MF3/22]